MSKTLSAILALSLLSAACGSGSDTVAQSESTEVSTTDGTTPDHSEVESSEDESSEDDAPHSTEAASETSTTDDSADPGGDAEAAAMIDPGDQPTLTLLDQGAEPRQEIRLAYEPGAYEMVIESTQTISQTLDGESIGGSPAIKTIAKQLVEVEVVDNGFQLTTRVTGMSTAPGTDPAITAQFEAAVAGVEDVVTIAVVDDRAQLLRSSIEGVDQLDPLLQQNFGGLVDSGQAATPFPQEPVGVGGSWEVVQTLSAGGIDLTQTSVFTVLAIDATQVQLAVEIHQDAALGPVDLAGLPAGTEVDLLEFDGGGSTTLTYTLATPVPDSSLSSETNQALSITDGGTTSILGQAITLDVSVHP